MTLHLKDLPHAMRAKYAISGRTSSLEHARLSKTAQLVSETVSFAGETKLLLPIIPPSLNRIWRGRGDGRFYKANVYEQWLADVGHIVNRQTDGRITSPVYTAPVSVTVAMKRPQANADLDNRLKPLGDLLQRHHIVNDDRIIHAWTAYWSDDLTEGVEVEMSIRPLGAA